MKRLPFIAGIFMILLSCSSGAEKGALETETLSKKTFEALKTNDYNIFMNLLPDHDTFKRLAEIESDSTGIDAVQTGKDFDLMNARSREGFEMIRTHPIDWKNAEYENTSDEVTKTGNVTVSSVSMKISSGSEFYKVTFTGKKINGRWYSMGDLFWVPK